MKFTGKIFLNLTKKIKVHELYNGIDYLMKYNTDIQPYFLS